MKRIDEFEQKLDELLDEFSDVDCEELADSFEYYMNEYIKKSRT